MTESIRITTEELDELYSKVERLKAKKKTVTTYGCVGDVDDLDGDVLCDFMEYIYNCHPKERPDWLEAFYQILCWQFQSFHEAVFVYYENFYGESDYSKIIKTADFLQKNGYTEIEEQYRRGIAACEQCEHSEEEVDIGEIDEWLNRYPEPVWEFCLDILEKNKLKWPPNSENC